MSLSHIREQRHETGALDGVSQFSLVLGADAGMPRIDDLRLARNKTPQKVHFLIIDVVQILRAEKALSHGIVLMF